MRCVPFSRNIWTRGVWITLSIWLGITMIPWVLLDYLGILHHLPKQTMMWKKSVACGQPSMVTLSAPTVVSTPIRSSKAKSRFHRSRVIVSSFSKIRTLLTRASSLMPKIKKILRFFFQGSRLKPPKMLRFTPSIWRITTSNSPLMTRHACCRLLFMIIWMEIPFLSVTLAS